MTIHQGVAGHCYRKTEGKVESILVNLSPWRFHPAKWWNWFEKGEAQKLTPRGAYLWHSHH